MAEQNITDEDLVGRDGVALHVGDLVRRGRGTTTWRITRISDLVALESVCDGWTHSSVTRDKAHTLARVGFAPDTPRP